MRRGRARDPLDVVRPADRLARSLLRQMLRNEGVRTQRAADPLGTVDAAGDDGTVLVDDLHDAALRKVTEPQAFLEMFELHADGRTKVVTETRKLENVNECFDDVLAGAVDARLVFDMR